MTSPTNKPSRPLLPPWWPPPCLRHPSVNRPCRRRLRPSGTRRRLHVGPKRARHLPMRRFLRHRRSLRKARCHRCYASGPISSSRRCSKRSMALEMALRRPRPARRPPWPLLGHPRAGRPASLRPCMQVPTPAPASLRPCRRRRRRRRRYCSRRSRRGGHGCYRRLPYQSSHRPSQGLGQSRLRQRARAFRRNRTAGA